MAKITQEQLYSIILERGFPEISKTIKRQVLQGVQTHDLTFLEIGQIIWYMYDKKGYAPNPMYGLGPIYNIKDEALGYFKSLEIKTKSQEQAMEQRLEDEKDDKHVIRVVPQTRKFHKKQIDLDKL